MKQLGGPVAMNDGRTDPWLRRANMNSQGTIRLFCFHHAGAGASTFNAWPKTLGSHIELWKVQLPGREDNWQTPALRNVHELIDRLLPEIAPLLDVPYAFYGHSMGAIVAFELARSIRNAALPQSAHLFVSGRRAPQLALSHRPLFSLPFDELMSQLREMGATSLALYERTEWRDRLLATIRADLEVSDVYVYRDGFPLDVPIDAFGGVTDSSVQEWEWMSWNVQTSRRFQGTSLSGHHILDQAGKVQLMNIIDQTLSM